MEPTESQLRMHCGRYTDATGTNGVQIEAENQGDTVDQVEIDFVYKFEPPKSPAAISSYPSDGSMRFAVAGGQQGGPLKAGEKRIFQLPPQTMRLLTALVNLLDPEDYHISVTTNGKKEVGLSGSVFGEYFKRMFGSK